MARPSGRCRRRMGKKEKEMKDSSHKYPKFDIQPRVEGNFSLIVRVNSVLYHEFEMCTKDIAEMGDKLDFLRDRYTAHIFKDREDD